MRIILADDHAIFREGLKLLLHSRPDFCVVAEIADLEHLKTLLYSQQADLLILDYHIPGGDAVALLAYCKARYPDLKVIALTGSHSGPILKQLVAAKADGVLLKDSAAAELLLAIQQVMRGGHYVSEAVGNTIADIELPLSTRELQILKLIFSGLVTREIAEKLALSPKTVDKHRENIMRKLQVNNLVELINKTHQLKLFEL
ncbi:LuxR C-terminal-related transcriptional regulator [Methylovulum psychrotolerans]|uniref:DNA-binding response regulator n=1 Tax=Methylovulum psychrotolerans TaxID=1704499 RepID=A0A1Z4BVU3_9GAMM|nr:response regulator transcription factor [Methylovulum psychrotolerans]ASF45416.1 DNA-binding response regulator [Methylovulum psychrotolerans]POZ50081.1 DNA-binding response regulator [Methylovulum psychrotolerans]